MTPSPNRLILGAALTVGVLTLAVKGASMVKDALVASAYGAGDTLDAFTVALILPTYLINVVSGPISAALVPVQVQVRATEGDAAAARLFRGLSFLTLVSLAAVALLLAGVGWAILPLISSGFGEAKRALTRGLFFVLLPIVVLNGLVITWEAALTASRRFALTSIAGMTVPVATAVAFLALRDKLGIFALALGLIAGLVLQLTLLGWGLRRENLGGWPRWYGFEPALRRALGQYLPTFAGAAILSSTAMIDQAMAAMLPKGSVAALGYGNKLVAMVISVSTMALGNAVLPYFSEMAARRDWRGLRQCLRTYGRLVLLVTIPATLCLAYFSEPLVQMLYQRGKFTAQDTRLVAQVQAMYLLQLPFMTLGILFVRSISSLQANQILFWGNILSFVLNVSLNYLLMQRLGVAGIALSTTVVYAVACGYLGVMVHRRLKCVEARVDGTAPAWRERWAKTVVQR